MRNVWVRRILLFAAGVGLFLGVRALWGEEGVRGGRIAAIAILSAGFVALVVLFVATRRRAGAASEIARLLRANRIDEAVRTGRELFDKSPADPHVAWYYVAALMKSGHLAEARRVFAGLKAESLPPKMAAMHGEVRRALEGSGTAGPGDG